MPVLPQKNKEFGFPYEPLRVVVYRMAETNLTRLPVVERDPLHKLVGIVSLTDLLKARTRNLQEERSRERVLRLCALFPLGQGSQTVAESVAPDADRSNREEAQGRVSDEIAQAEKLFVKKHVRAFRACLERSRLLTRDEETDIGTGEQQEKQPDKRGPATLLGGERRSYKAPNKTVDAKKCGEQRCKKL